MVYNLPSVRSRVSISSCTTLSLVEFFYEDEVGLLMLGNDHLCYALARLYGEGFVGEIYQHHAYLTTVVGVYGARGIEYCQSVLESQSAAWAHLCLIAFWKCDKESCGNQSPLQWL